MILARIYTNFGENHGKLKTTKSTNATGDWTRHFPSISLEGRTAQPLVGPVLCKDIWPWRDFYRINVIFFLLFLCRREGFDCYWISILFFFFSLRRREITCVKYTYLYGVKGDWKEMNIFCTRKFGKYLRITEPIIV